MGNFKKCFLRAVNLILLTALLLGFFSWLFYPRNNRAELARDAVSGNKLLSEPGNTIDVLFIGDSQAYSSVSPMQLWEEAGITAYVSGTGGQAVFELADFVRVGFEKQNFKFVILEVDTLFYENSLADYAYNKLKRIVPLLQYHDRWKRIGTPVLTLTEQFDAEDHFKGFYFYPWCEPYIGDIPDYLNVSEDVSIKRAARLSIQEIKTICDRNDAELVLFSAPNMGWNYSRYNAVSAIAEEFGLRFVDFNTGGYYVPIDWHTEAKDNGIHVNYNGATKVTGAVELFFSENYMLPDHRGEPGYENWNEAMERCREDIENERVNMGNHE